MFQNYNKFQTQLLKYLYNLNENINWDELIITSIQKNYDDVKILNLIKNRLWTDKNISGIDNLLHINRIDYFNYYTNILMIYNEKIKNKTILILDINENSNLIEELKNDLKLKINVLSSILTIYNYKFEIINSINIEKSNENYIIINTGLITFDKNISSNLFIIYDDYNNLCFQKFDDELNKIKLTIKSMLLSNIEISELIKIKYNMINCKKYIIQ